MAGGVEAPAPGGARLAVIGEVRAAGGVVVRMCGGEPEVLVVHRPDYGDWTFPKGKVEEDEDDVSCALREVAEETGLVCVLEGELPETRFDSPFGAKVVRWWRMRVVGGALRFEHEVDNADWLAPAQAALRLTYDVDRELLASALAAVPDA